jgi:hypothetical protein
MPNFHSRPRGGLLTPPSSVMHGYRSTGQGQYCQSGRKNFYEPTVFVPPPAPLMYQPPPMHYSNMPTAPPPGLPHPSFGPIAAPIIPSNGEITAQNLAAQRELHGQRRNQQPAKKQDKVVGGVAQELDYEMDQMTDYVSEMAQEMYALFSTPQICLADIDIVRSVMPRSKVSPPFRKFVSGLLSSTRLPSSTILLGLNYLAKRMTMLNTPTPYKTTDGQVWRMLTISLLLGSKFLDDNTFQNRSWSEVSGIPVSELNTLEMEWLMAIDFRLHVDPVTDSDFHLWLASWASWKENKNKQRTATLDRLAPLAPIDTNMQRQHSQRKSYSPASAYPTYGQSVAETRQPPSYQSQVHYEQPWSQPGSSTEMSPPSAPESGPNTPEWMMLPGSGLPPSEWYGYNTFYNNRRHQQSSTHMPYAPQVPPYQTPFPNNYSQSIWVGHHAGCGCTYCGRSSESYFTNSSYGQQTVAG